jgi:uncharacterized protein (TIGR02246 family)
MPISVIAVKAPHLVQVQRGFCTFCVASFQDLLRLFPVVLLFTVAACSEDGTDADAASSVDETSAVGAVIQMKSSIDAAFLAKDAGGIADLFAEDAVLVLPDGQLVTGRDSIETRIASLLPTVQGYSITTQRLRESGDLGYERETFSITLAGVGGAEPRTLAGHHLVALARGEDGAWKIMQSGIWIGQPEGMEGMAH